MRDFNRRNDNRKKSEMHQVVCDKCGKNCEVPFKPSSDKPIFCDDCFREKNRSNSNRSDGRNFVRNNSRERTYFKAICSECGKSCELPFRPTNDKPVFCSACFDKQGSGRERNMNSNSNSSFDKQFKIINEKLDQILQNMSQSFPKKKSIIDDIKILAVKKEKKQKVATKPKANKKVAEIKKVMKKKSKK